MILATEPPPDLTLEAAFTSFADHMSDGAQTKLRERLDFFRRAGLRSEEEVRKLPMHEAMNEREHILALQDALLPQGAHVALYGLSSSYPDLNGCNATTIGCLRDGTFRCAVELDASCLGGHFRGGTRVRVENLRPALDYGVPVAVDVDAVCSDDRADNDLPDNFALPLTDEAMGRLLVGAVQTHKRLASEGALPESMTKLGASAFPDLPMAAMLIAVDQLQGAGCVAIRAGDLKSAALAVRHGDELEKNARPTGLEMFELPELLRSALANLTALSATIMAAQGDASGAREAALVAARLQVSETVSWRKVCWVLSDRMVDRPDDELVSRELKVSLRRWWHKELLNAEEFSPQDEVRAGRGGAHLDIDVEELMDNDYY
jgi:hypothetical protein